MARTASATVIAHSPPRRGGECCLSFLIPHSIQEPRGAHPQPSRKGASMCQQPPDHRSDHPFRRPPPPPFRFILRLHLLIVRAAPDSLCHNLCGEHARLERVPHPFTAKRIHHAGCITNGDEVSGQSIVSERSGHQAVFSIDILAQRIFLYQETRVRASALTSHFNSACVQNLIDETEPAQTIDRTWRKKTATDFWTWKAVAFQSYGIDAHALQSPHTSGTCKASTDNDHVVHAHFSATSTRRYGKLL